MSAAVLAQELVAEASKARRSRLSTMRRARRPMPFARSRAFALTSHDRADVLTPAQELGVERARLLGIRLQDGRAE
jgi:hypothetical protein